MRERRERRGEKERCGDERRGKRSVDRRGEDREERRGESGEAKVDHQ